MTPRTVVAAGLLIAAAAIGGCNQAPSPTASTGGVTQDTPAAVRATLDWLQQHTMTCGGSSQFGQWREWTCVLDNSVAGPADLTVYRVIVTAQNADLREIEATVDQRLDSTTDINLTRGFVADTIGGSPATGAAGQAIVPWVVSALDKGGTATFGQIVASVTPFGALTEEHLYFSSK
ncbi:MAG: hypothetical protein QOI92_2883 [Chloroflexota bacterium]|jgi:hypothetical protein|nr:hypothetical protein [Chloroflexota bacterium]